MTTESFPPYSYVPGRFPHPVSDPAGHSFGQPFAAVEPLDPACFSRCDAYLHAVTLFNRGYYWEAHESLEQLWHAAGRRGPTADLLQGLIKLAAAGVKVREGRAAGTRSLSQGARVLFDRAETALGAPTHVGLCIAELIEFTRQAEVLATDAPDDDRGVRVVFPFTLCLRSDVKAK